MGISKYYYIAKTNFISSLTYIQDVIWSSTFIAIIIFIFVNLWKAIFGTNEYIAGFTIVMMLWYLVMTESIVTSQSRVLEDIGDELISGNITNYLNKPYNYILYKFSTSIGASLLKFAITFIAGSIVVYIFIGPMTIALWTIPLIAIIVMLALILNFTIMSFLGIFALWLEDAKSLEFVYNKIVFTLGGMLIPLEIFPTWLYKLSLLLPFSLVAYYPSKLFVSFSMMLFFKILLLEIIWIIIFVILATIAYKICIKKISINGG